MQMRRGVHESHSEVSHRNSNSTRPRVRVREGKRQIMIVITSRQRQRKIRTVKSKVQRSFAVLPLEAAISAGIA